MGSANEKRRYYVTPFLIGWAHTQNDPSESDWLLLDQCCHLMPISCVMKPWQIDNLERGQSVKPADERSTGTTSQQDCSSWHREHLHEGHATGQGFWLWGWGSFSPQFGHTESSSSNFKITRQIWGIWKLRPAYSPETPNLGQNRWCFVPYDLEIWWMTLENNRTSLLCCFKLCATFHSHWWIPTGVTVRKRPIWVKFDDF